MKYSYITIGREYGSGGRMIAQKVAQYLQIPFYDKEFIEMAAKETGLSEDYIQQAEGQKTSSFLYNLSFSSNNLPVSDQVFIAECDVIKQLAQKGPGVFVGRCADYVLREEPDLLRVFIHAPLADRMARAQAEYGVQSQDIRTYVLRRDKARGAYYNHFTTNVWGKSQNYDLACNSKIGLDLIAELIVQAAQGGRHV